MAESDPAYERLGARARGSASSELSDLTKSTA
jgi:hypothetical protein